MTGTLGSSSTRQNERLSQALPHWPSDCPLTREVCSYKASFPAQLPTLLASRKQHGLALNYSLSCACLHEAAGQSNTSHQGFGSTNGPFQGHKKSIRRKQPHLLSFNLSSSISPILAMKYWPFSFGNLSEFFCVVFFLCGSHALVSQRNKTQRLGKNLEILRSFQIFIRTWGKAYECVGGGKRGMNELGHT